MFAGGFRIKYITVQILPEHRPFTFFYFWVFVHEFSPEV